MSDSYEHDRVVAIGDLNGALDVLRSILRGIGVIDDDDGWIGGRTHVIQTGDVFDRGGGQACACLRFLRELGQRAQPHGGRVTQLLGNHEVMAALGDERWRTIDEYLAFATESEREEWRAVLQQTKEDIESRHPGLPKGVVLALIESWKRSSAPGRSTLEKAMSETGDIGQALRQLPVAVIARDVVFCHGGLAPEWARLGIDGLAEQARDAWHDPRESECIFQDERGPLWNRQLVLGNAARAADELRRSLNMLGVERMVVGHTPTAHVKGGKSRRIATLHDDRLVCIDVGLPPGKPGIALLVDERGGHEWKPRGERTLWLDS